MAKQSKTRGRRVGVRAAEGRLGRGGRKAANVRETVSKVARRVQVKRSVGSKKSMGRVESAKVQRAKDEKEVYKVDVKKVIEDITANNAAMDYLHKNVSKMAGEVITSLNTPKTDEMIAEELDIKINTVRRILNIMYGYGITNYNVIKSQKGWLSFLWSVNLKKVNGFYDYISKNDNNTAMITENTNDYFICKGCYDNNKLVFDFDSAFEASFKCVLCGGKLQRLDRVEAKRLVETRNPGNFERFTV